MFIYTGKYWDISCSAASYFICEQEAGQTITTPTTPCPTACKSEYCATSVRPKFFYSILKIYDKYMISYLYFQPAALEKVISSIPSTTVCKFFSTLHVREI
jgi:hypothetical protein